MITSLAIRNYKAIKELPRLPIRPFQVLVGPNGSGKTTFLDALDFVRDCLDLGPRGAVEARVPQYPDLTFRRLGGPIEIELWLNLEASGDPKTAGELQYRLIIDRDDALGVKVVEEELRRPSNGNGKKTQKLAGKTAAGGDTYQRENGTYKDSFVFGLGKLTLAETPPDHERYPTAMAVKLFMLEGLRYLQLNSRAMREPCLATRPTALELDGSNLARVVGSFHPDSARGQFNSLRSAEVKGLLSRWTEHLRFALPELREIGWKQRQDDNAEYLVLRFADGLECPSWLLSDGTLRMLALTLPAFLPPSPGTFMVEEPENGVHPKALEIILSALQSIPGSQAFVATHSPQVVQQVGRDALLCFSKDERGARIVPGSDHPILKDWDGTPDLATVFSSGVLG